MSQNEKDLLVSTVVTASQLPKDKQQRLLGYAEGLAAVTEAQATKAAAETKKED